MDDSESGEESPFEMEMPSEDEAMSEQSEWNENAMVIDAPEARRTPFVIMNRTQLAERQRRMIADASDLLCVTPEEGFLLLQKHAWDLSKLQESWFAGEDTVRQTCGLAPSSSSSATGATCGANPPRCPICLQNKDSFFAMECGHAFCHECWTGYLHCQVDDGKAAVQARCPQHKCGRIVPSRLFDRYCDEARRSKFQEWFLCSYVDNNPSVKWCTNPGGCANAIELRNADSLEVTCSCDFVGCWSCGEEAHRPADCKTVERWIVKNSAESENISWIRANTKNCPHCRKPIEKNQGCNHMVCSKAGGCGHEFCWQCLGDWKTHGTSTGGYYQCNIYEKQAKEGKYQDAEKDRAEAKHALDRYIFFFERFMEHDRALKLTLKQEADLEHQIPSLHDHYNFDVTELQFLYDAVRQVRACRRVLKWSYVYGYYLEDETGVEKNLFEHLQRNLEEKNDSLHEMLEKEFHSFLQPARQTSDLSPRGGPQPMEDSSAPSKPDKKTFLDFRSRVTNFTNVTQKFLTQILTDLGSDQKLSADRSAGSDQR